MNPIGFFSNRHLLATGSVLGPAHYVTGLTAGFVLRATSATNAAFQQLTYADLGGSLPDPLTVGEVRFKEPGAGANYSAFKSQFQTVDVTYSWPTAGATTSLTSVLINTGAPSVSGQTLGWRALNTTDFSDDGTFINLGANVYTRLTNPFIVPILYGDDVASGTLTFRSTTDSTKGDINLDDTVHLWPNYPSVPPTGTTRLMRFDTGYTKSVSSSSQYGFEFSSAITHSTITADTRLIYYHPTITQTVGPAVYPFGYNFRALESSPLFQSSVNGVQPFMPDTIWDGTQMLMTSNAGATESSWVAVSLICEHNFSATNGGKYALTGNGLGAGHPNQAAIYYHPNFITSGVNSLLTFSGAAAAVYCLAPNISQGAGSTVSLTGRLCGMYLEDTANVSPGFTSNHTIYSAGVTVSMLHAGPIRIGDISANPTASLEVYKQRNTVGIDNLCYFANQPLDFNTNTSSISGINLGAQAVWTVSTDTVGNFQGANLFWFNSIVRSNPANITRVMGQWNGFYFQPNFQVNATAGGTCTVNIVRGLSSEALFQRSSTSGVITVTELTDVFSKPTVSAGGTATTRRGLWFNAISGAGTVTTAYGLDVENLVVGTTAAAVHSNLTSGTGKYFLMDDGGAQSKFAGKITTYNNIATASVGMPFIPAEVNLTAQGGNISNTTLYAIPAAAGGVYRVNAFITVSRAATSSSTMPAVTIGWSVDTAAGTAQTVQLTASNAGNVLTTFAQAVAIIRAKSSTNIQYSTNSFASTGGTSMQYDVYLRVEAV